jgi:hypothetical protein
VRALTDAVFDRAEAVFEIVHEVHA